MALTLPTCIKDFKRQELLLRAHLFLFQLLALLNLFPLAKPNLLLKQLDQVLFTTFTSIFLLPIVMLLVQSFTLPFQMHSFSILSLPFSIFQEEAYSSMVSVHLEGSLVPLSFEFLLLSLLLSLGVLFWVSCAPRRDLDLHASDQQHFQSPLLFIQDWREQLKLLHLHKKLNSASFLLLFQLLIPLNSLHPPCHLSLDQWLNLAHFPQVRSSQQYHFRSTLQQLHLKTCHR